MAEPILRNEVAMSPVDEFELRGCIDRQAIEDLLYRYSDIVTRGAWDEDESLFVPDAVLEIASPFDTRVEGAEAIRQYRAGTASFEFLIHTTFAPVIRLLAHDRAQATSQTHEMVRSLAGDATADGQPAALNAEFFSVYYDEILRINGDWRFAHRRCIPIYAESGALMGQALATRSSLWKSG